MHPEIRKLFLAFDIPCTEMRLSAALHPYRLGGPLFGPEPVMALAFLAVSGEGGDDLVAKFPAAGNAAAGLPIRLADTREAIEHEARVLAAATAVGVRNVVRLVEDRTDQDLPFLVMARLGQSLHEAAGLGEGALDLRAWLRVAHDVAAGLEGLHGTGLFHNDVKPENILSGPAGWTLIDPAPPEYGTADYRDDRFPVGAERDVYALGRALQEVGGDLADGDDHPEVDRLLAAMLGEARKVPAATKVRRDAARLLRALFGEHVPPSRPG